MIQPESPYPPNLDTTHDLVAMIEHHLSDPPSFAVSIQIAGWHFRLASLVDGNSVAKRRASRHNIEMSQRWRQMADDERSRVLPDFPDDRRRWWRLVDDSRETLRLTTQVIDGGDTTYRQGWLSLWRAQRRLTKEW